MTIGIMGAMDEEVADIVSLIQSPTTHQLGSRTYYRGTLAGKKVVLARSRIGKVASASTATTLIDRFGSETIIFTGVAGGVDPMIKRGDVVIGTSLIQFDVDASPLPQFKKFEIPLLNTVYFKLCEQLRAKARSALHAVLPSSANVIHEGIIGSSDHFIADPARTHALRKEIPGLLAVEMEGAAVAQVCHEWNIPLTVIRAISDTADHEAADDFHSFLVHFAAPLSARVVHELVKKW